MRLTDGSRLPALGGAADRLLDDLLVGVVPHLPVRSLLALRQEHGGLSGDELAAALISAAAKATAAIGAAAGALAAVELAAPPTLLAAPAQVVAETVAVVGVELRLVAELHVVYGRVPQGSSAQVLLAYLLSWAARRPADETGDASLTGVLSAAARLRVRRRLVRRLRANLASLVPFLAGAVLGAELNRRETRGLGATLTAALRPGTSPARRGTG